MTGGTWPAFGRRRGQAEQGPAPSEVNLNYRMTAIAALAVGLAITTAAQGPPLGSGNSEPVYSHGEGEPKCNFTDRFRVWGRRLMNGAGPNKPRVKPKQKGPIEVCVRWDHNCSAPYQTACKLHEAGGFSSHEGSPSIALAANRTWRGRPRVPTPHLSWQPPHKDAQAATCARHAFQQRKRSWAACQARVLARRQAAWQVPSRAVSLPYRPGSEVRAVLSDSVGLTCRANLTDGRVFARTQPGESMEVSGSQATKPCPAEGLLGMRGASRKCFVCPPRRDFYRPKFPTGSTLIQDIELLEILKGA